MNRRSAIAFAALLLLVAVGAAILLVSEPKREGTHPPDDFVQNLDKWHAEEPAAYRYRVHMRCECDGRPVLVEVRNGKVTLAHFDSPGSPESLSVHDMSYRALPIGRYFEFIRNGYEAHFNRVEVKYDPELGYPMSLYLDPSKDVVDDEILYELSELQVVHDG